MSSLFWLEHTDPPHSRPAQCGQYDVLLTHWHPGLCAREYTELGLLHSNPWSSQPLGQLLWQSYPNRSQPSSHLS